MDNRYNRHNRRKYSLKVPIVLVTKYRRQLLKGTIADDVKQKIFDICNSNSWNIIAMETDKDHVHFLVSYDATDRVCDIVKVVKRKGQILRSTPNTAPLICGACNTQPEDLLTTA
ncbi:IS200/IS605 family transposase [Fusicatenibacter sp.]